MQLAKWEWEALSDRSNEGGYERARSNAMLARGVGKGDSGVRFECCIVPSALYLASVDANCSPEDRSQAVHVSPPRRTLPKVQRCSAPHARAGSAAHRCRALPSHSAPRTKFGGIPPPVPGYAAPPSSLPITSRHPFTTTRPQPQPYPTKPGWSVRPNIGEPDNE